MEDSQKLKLFPSTLKGATLKWFMGLVTQSIRTWNDMKQTFLDKYLDYCMSTNNKDELFKMVQKEDENLEDLLERFQYNLKRAKMINLDEVSPLVIVPKKSGKWRVCIDYGELNKEILKDHFPFPFIDQVLDTLAGNKYFSFLDGFTGYNQI